ncbi:MAG: hypothetical protein EON54_27060 [Alcaligenaceae bacterium]|nr:MAG: hypothetical protein EON54_27060 [Alcaligenaceae bacterium]
MNKQSIRLIPAAAAVALTMAMAGTAFAQITTSPPNDTKELMDPANKTMAKSNPTTKETRDQRAAAKNKNTMKAKTGADVAVGTNGTPAPSLATGNAGDPSRPANSTK